jgi:hypothetical protein
LTTTTAAYRGVLPALPAHSSTRAAPVTFEVLPDPVKMNEPRAMPAFAVTQLIRGTVRSALADADAGAFRTKYPA